MQACDSQARAFVPPRHPSLFIPHRIQQVLISWIFIWASVTLLLDFLALQCLLSFTIPKTGPQFLQDFANYGNWFGIVSCFSWLLGFILLQQWLTSVGATSGSHLGCGCKVLASVLFNLQPMTGSAGVGEGAGLWWSNLIGIIFFHSGNCISCFDMWRFTPPGADKNQGWGFHGNLPVTGMWVYQTATWFLVTCNVLACNWGKNPDIQFLPTTHWFTFLCQVTGCLLLLLGSLIYCKWCDGFRNFSHDAAPKDGSA